jgi:hypothetical protein
MRGLAARALNHIRSHGISSAARAAARRLSLLGRSALPGSSPVNYGALPTDDARIRADAEYALRIARSYVSLLDRGAASLSGKTVIELGPGPNLGTALALRCMGAKRVAVADRFLVRYQPGYHDRVYRALTKLLKSGDSETDVEALERCVAERRHAPQALALIETPLETLSQAAGERFDLTLSNAVLEHLYHPMQALRSLAAISAPNSVGLHQVDFRDHRDFSRPLEYLLLDEFSFHELLQGCHAECGNRVRPDAMHSMFSGAGFASVDFSPNIWADDAYLADFVPRLRAAKASPYAGADERNLHVVSGRFTVRRHA